MFQPSVKCGLPDSQQSGGLHYVMVRLLHGAEDFLLLQIGQRPLTSTGLPRLFFIKEVRPLNQVAIDKGGATQDAVL